MVTDDQKKDPAPTKVKVKWPLGKDEYLSVPVVSRRSTSSGGHVVALQKALGVSVTGRFNSETRDAVLAFQKKHKLAETGVVDKKTWDKLPAV